MVKGHLGASCEIGWKCESSLFWKVEIWLELKLRLWIQYGTLCMFIQPTVIYPWSKVIRGQVVRWTQNVKFRSYEKLKSDWRQTSFVNIMKEPSHVQEVEGHLRSTSMIAWKCKIWHYFYTWGPLRTMWPPQVWDQGQVSIWIINKLGRQATLAVQDSQCIL